MLPSTSGTSVPVTVTRTSSAGGGATGTGRVSATTTSAVAKGSATISSGTFALKVDNMAFSSALFSLVLFWL